MESLTRLFKNQGVASANGNANANARSSSSRDTSAPTANHNHNPKQAHKGITKPLKPQNLVFSEWSSPGIKSGGWCCEDFVLGAGMVIIQPSTEKVVVVDEMVTIDVGVEDDTSARAKGKGNVGTKKRETQPKTVSASCFLPRGRKDKGESVQQAAFREAFEESGYEVSPLPLYVFNRQPLPPHQREADTGLTEEAIYLTTQSWGPRYRDGKCIDKGGQYFVSWFVGQIPEKPIHHTGVGMPDEQNYVSRLVPFEEALNALSDPLQKCVLNYAWQAYRNHLHYDRELKKLEVESTQPEAGTRVGVRHEENTSGEQ